MINAEPNSISQVIQLAIAPVFLLSGVAPLLIVLTNRMGRIIDRYRVLEKERRLRENAQAYESIDNEMHLLDRRSKYINYAIALCTCCALFICVVIASLFLGSLLHLKFALLIPSLFIIAMLFLILGLLSFLKEIKIATGSIYSVVEVEPEKSN